MRFKEFLYEARHREDISIEKARELLENCSDMDIKKPLWRGSRKAAEECYVIEGEKGSRSSANTTNYYTILIDHFFPKEWPRRGKSIIVANNTGKAYAKTYAGSGGGLYAILPFNGVKIGVCPHEDIWETKFAVGHGREKSMEFWNGIWDDAHLPDFSYEDFVNGIRETMQGLASGELEGRTEEIIDDIFRRQDNIEEYLAEAYSPENLGMHLASSKDINKYNNTGRECWIGGKCLALRHDIWQQIAESDEDINLDHDYEK